MLTIVRKSRFKKDFKKLQSSGKNPQKLAEIIRMLANGEELPERNRDHALIGDYINHRECHITPDWRRWLIICFSFSHWYCLVHYRDERRVRSGQHWFAVFGQEQALAAKQAEKSWKLAPTPFFLPEHAVQKRLEWLVIRWRSVCCNQWSLTLKARGD